MTLSDDEIMNLVRQVRSGDQAALNPLLAALRPKIYRIVAANLLPQIAHRADQSDATQEMLIHLGEKFGDFRGENIHQLWAWMRKMLRSTLNDLLDKHLFAECRSINREAVPNSSIAFSPFESPSSTPSSAVAQRDFMQFVLASISPVHREVLELHYLHKMNMSQIGKQLGCDWRTVSNRLSAALAEAAQIRMRELNR